MTPPRETRFMQMCWVVPDLDRAIADWVRTAGVGPFFVFEQVPFDNPVYRGQPTTSPDIRAAMAQAGEMQVELVELRHDGPSVWTDVVGRGGAGLHHTALVCEDYDAQVAAYAAAEAEVAFSGLMMGAPVCWVDTTKTLGFMVELITANPIAAAVFAQIREAAEHWDGKDPVRTLG
jgi:Glyoxalase/Bleomycin resistance protein/Dioxygenase superfamily